MSILNSYHYPKPAEEGLKLQYVGKRLAQLPTPAAIIDIAATRRNCEAMLAAIEDIGGLDFRPHVKTHKTSELTELQINGYDRKRDRAAKLVVSTVAEIEHLLPWLLEKKRKGTLIDVLYGLPVSPSSLPRLAAMVNVLGLSSNISLLVDNPDCVDIIAKAKPSWPGVIEVFVKIDTGYHRAGVEPDSEPFWAVVRKLTQQQDKIHLRGIYSHLGNSYDGDSVEDAVNGLKLELEKLHQAGKLLAGEISPVSNAFIYSVGATPTATAVQNLAGDTPNARGFRHSLTAMRRELENKGIDLTIELHAGVYPLLDLQQLATHARPKNVNFYSLSSEPSHRYAGLSIANLGLYILAEVASLYPHRAKPEGLIAAGTLALGREPCKAYPGWGIVSPWGDGDVAWHWNHNYENGKAKFYDLDLPEADRTGWIVGRISQEHGMLTWEGPPSEKRELKPGQKLLIWPNHACIAGSGFGCYFIIDSDSADSTVVRDVWVRCRGW